MIDVGQARADLEKLDADDVIVSKAQYAHLLDEVSRGNAARILLTNVRSILGANAMAGGLGG